MKVQKKGGAFGPYKQSERKELYKKYAESLVEGGHAYYAFDTAEELEEMRTRLRSDENPTPQYDRTVRMQMRNSLTLSAAEVTDLLEQGIPHVIRIRMQEGEQVSFTDLIRGEVQFDTSLSDDKVLLKGDGMPTYHLAVVVDDYLMQITHAFRGEEWLPSAPVHVLLWRYLFGEEAMPQWAHLPLILGPSGKLSKRDGAKYGFPVFAMNWTAGDTGETIEGFRERGFLPEAFVNLLALLGWNDGTEEELFTLPELVERFSIDKVHKGGAKFDFDKAKWFNHEWIKRSDNAALLPGVKKVLAAKGINPTDEILEEVIPLVKDRCTFLPDFYEHSAYFFEAPQALDAASVKPKWSEVKESFFQNFIGELESTPEWSAAFIEAGFKAIASVCNIKPGELQLPFRIMLVGGKFGPPVFDIAAIIGKEETVKRIRFALPQFK